MNIRNLSEANKALLPYVSQVPYMTGNDPKLERVRRLMGAIGNPQDSLRVIHIAGTSGKTSTAYYMAALLQAAGQKTGLTISPHVDSITERVQVGGVPLPEAEFCRELADFLEIVQRAGQSPSYFELMYGFALWVFVRKSVDYAVVETGIGGLYDATNVAERTDKICVITDIGFDHQEVLGGTLAQIAKQKIGIVHDSNDLFMYEQAGEVMAVTRDWAAKHQASLHLLNEPAESHAHQKDLAGIAGYQRRNWLLAYSVYRYLEKRDNLKHLTRQVLPKTWKIAIPGRMDTRQVQGKTLVMDGAHNLQKITACLNSFRQIYPGIKPAVLISVKESKDYKELVPPLLPFASRIIVTTFDATQDSQSVSMDPETLAKAFRTADMAVEVITDQHKAYQVLLAGPEQTCLITGSFYLLSQIRNNEKLV